MQFINVVYIYNIYFYADEAMPALLAAEKALKELNKNDIVEVKALKKPPAGVMLVVETLCVVFDIKPIKVSMMHKLIR